MAKDPHEEEWTDTLIVAACLFLWIVVPLVGMMYTDGV